MDLSHPEGASVNNGIEPELCSLGYMSVDEAVRRTRAWGRGTLMEKLEVSVKSTYRMVPVHLTDRPFLSMVWKGINAVYRFSATVRPTISTQNLQ